MVSNDSLLRKTQAVQYAEYMSNRATKWKPLVATAVSMVAMGIVCVVNRYRITKEEGPVQQQDLVLTMQTIFINSLVLVMLFLVHRSDNSFAATVNKFVDAEKAAQVVDAEAEEKELGFSGWVKWCADWGDPLLLPVSLFSILMPVQGLVAVVRYEDVPVSQAHKLPHLMNGIFAVGFLAYILANLWLLMSAMSRPVRRTWQMRTDMIQKIKDASKHEDWDELVKQLTMTDHILKHMWSPSEAGGLWCAAILAVALVAVSATLALLDHYTLQSGNISDVLQGESVNLGYCLVNVLLAGSLGLVLASTTFVSPFWFGRKAGPDAHSTHDELHCILSTAMFATHDVDSEARVERMRFTQCAHQLHLGASICGVVISQELAFRVYFQMGVVAPTIVAALHSSLVHRFHRFGGLQNPGPNNTSTNTFS